MDKMVRETDYSGNDVPKEKQVSLFISLLGSEGYELLCNLCTPENPTNLTLEHLAEIMQEHLQSRSSVIAYRYKFQESKQRKERTLRHI